MVASLLKIVSTGMQDERLQPPKGQPSASAFLTVLLKAGRYATNWTRIDFDTSPNFGKSSVIRLPTKGELIGRIYLVTQMPDIKSQQLVAYYTRKPIRLATNYTSKNLYDGNGKYLESISFTYPLNGTSLIWPVDDIGLANFVGVQLDDLIIDGVYTLSVQTPPTTVATFSMLLTDKPLNPPQFNQLNTDTFMLIGTFMYTSADPFLRYSYNGNIWNDIALPSGINPFASITRTIQFNGSQYIAAGRYNRPIGSVIIENDILASMTQPLALGDPDAYGIAYNGSRYVMVGTWQPTIGMYKQISYSNDGLNWSVPVSPPLPVVTPPVTNTYVSETRGNSVIWNAFVNKWFVVGSWIISTIEVDPPNSIASQTGILTTSTDGISWTAPSFITLNVHGNSLSVLNKMNTFSQTLSIANARIQTLYQTIIDFNDYSNLGQFLNQYDFETPLTNVDIPLLTLTTTEFKNALTANALPLEIQDYLTYITGTITSIGPLLSEYEILNPAIISLCGDINLIVSLASSLSFIIGNLFGFMSSGLPVSTFNSNMSSLLNTEFPGYIAQVNLLLTTLNTYYTDGNILCNNITAALLVDPTGSLLTPGVWPIPSKNTVWYPVMTAFNTLSNDISNCFSVSSDTVLYSVQVLQVAVNNTLAQLIIVNPMHLAFINTIVTATETPFIKSGSAYSIAINNTTGQMVVGGKFYSSTDNSVYVGSLITSTDGGQTWIGPTEPGGSIATNNITTAVAWSGSLWVAAGQWGFGTISLSTDGINWQEPLTPVNSVPAGPATSIGISPTAIIVGGNWQNLNMESVTLSKASGTSLGYNWLDLIRPTLFDTDTIFVHGLGYGNSQYLLLARWNNANNQYGAVSLSTDGIRWKDPFIPFSATYNNTVIYDAATDGNVWVLVGGIGKVSPKTKYGSIVVSANIVLENPETDWNAPIHPDGIINQIPITNSIGQAVIYYDTIFIVVGNWDLTAGGVGFITATKDTNSFPIPYSIPGLEVQNAYAITRTSFTVLGNPVYIVAGYFGPTNSGQDVNGIVYLILNDTDVISTTVTGPRGYAYGVAWNGLADSEAVYVAVGAFFSATAIPIGSMSYSTDGINWSTPFFPPGVISGSGNSVSWNGSQFVVTGAWNPVGTISISRDGINWSPPASPDGVVGTTNVALKSVWNGVTWVAAGNWLTTTSPKNVSIFTYGIAFNTPVNPQLATSIQSDGPSFQTGPTSIVWNPNESEWIASGDWGDTSGNRGYISRSPDGQVWATPALVPTTQRTEINQILITQTPYRIYMVGLTRFIPYSIITSNDGFSWTPQLFSNGIDGIVKEIAWNGTMWVAVSEQGFEIIKWGQTIKGNIITSMDGINWSNPILPPIPNTPSVQALINSPEVVATGYYYFVTLSSVAWSGTLWVAVGRFLLSIDIEPYSYVIGEIVTSPDGVNWTVRPRADNLGAFGVGRSVAWNGSMWLAAGNFANNTDIIRSTDGYTWTEPIAISGLSSADPTMVAWNGYIWAIVGIFLDNTGTRYAIITSSDGINWTPRIFDFDPTSYSDQNLYSISWNGSLWIATGLINYTFYPEDDPEYPETTQLYIIVTSVDGIVWTLKPPLETDTLQLMTVGNKRIKSYIRPQSFDPNLQVTSYPDPNLTDFVLKWVRDSNYGTGTEYFTRISDQNQQTYTFTATNRTQWLTFGTYYNSPPVVTITLTRVSPTNPTFQTDLAGPRFGWTNNLGHSLIDSASITIGGNLVETINGQLMEILDEFQTPLEKVSEVSKLLCRKESGFNQLTYGFSNTTSQKVITPLPFWFSRGDPGCVLPIDALNVDEVRLTVNYKPITSLYYTDSRATNPAINVEGGSLWPLLNSQFYYEDTSGVVIPNMEPTRAYNNAPILAFPKTINMPPTLTMPESYLLVEYIYLDKAEANRFRIADLQVPIVQHYIINPEDTNNNTFAKIRLDIPNPTRDLFFYCQRYEAPSLNAHFLGTRDLSKNQTDPYALWWPDATGLDARYPGTLKPGFYTSGSEPIRWLALNYAETLNRYSTENVALFRSFLPSIEQRKAPWINRYYYNLPFGINNGLNPFSMPLGQANLDKIQRLNLSLGFHGITGDPTDNYAERFWLRTYAETYNIFRVYGGRGTMMFAY
jgi:hypothetical protein